MAVRARVELLVTALTSTCNPGTQTHLVAHPFALYKWSLIQHVFFECGSDAQGLDAFVRVSRDLPAFNRPAPVALEVLNCCIVPVSI